MPLGGALAVGGIGALTSGIFGYFGDKAQANAAADAAEQNRIAAEEARQAAAQAAGYSISEQQSAMPQVLGALDQGYQGNLDYSTQGFGQQRQDVLQSGQLGAGAIQQGQQGALGATYGGASQGVDYLSNAQAGLNGSLNSGLQASGDILMNRQDRAGSMLDQQGGLFGNLQMDPGYQFGMNQGLDAVQNRFSADGGRGGGAAMKAVNDYAQNYATTHYNDAANRQLQAYGAASNSDAQALQASGQLAGQYGQAASQMAGSQQANGSQAANMAYGAGQGAANIYGQGGAQLADIYGRTGTQLGAYAGAAGQTLGNMTQGYFGNVGNVAQGYADRLAGYYQGAAGVAQQQLPLVMQNNQSQVPYAGAGYAAAGNAAGQLGQIALLNGMYGQNGAYGGGATSQSPIPDPNFQLQQPNVSYGGG